MPQASLAFGIIRKITFPFPCFRLEAALLLRPQLRTLSEGGDGAAGLLPALQEAVLGLGRDLVDQLAVVGVWVHRQKLLLGDQVGGLEKKKKNTRSGR